MDLLVRFRNGVPEVQLTCLKHLKNYFVNHPELRDDLEGKLHFGSAPIAIFFLQTSWFS